MPRELFSIPLRPVRAHLVSLLPVICGALLALLAGGCAKEARHAAGDTAAPPAVSADSGAGAPRGIPDTGTMAAPLTPGASPGSVAPGIPRPGASPDTSKAGAKKPAGAAPQGAAPTRAEVDRLYARARALARTEECSTPSECRAAPAGSRGCGGPSEYIVYCPARTDVARLTAVLAQLERTEKAYNVAHQVGSTCEMREPPTVTLENGRCAALVRITKPPVQ